MPFYLRKSISVGPFRMNLSKSGLGFSAGVKGLRIGTGPRGHYIHAGMNGIHYRKTLGGVGTRRKPASKSVAQHHPEMPEMAIHDKLPSYITEDGVLMQRIMSAEAELLVSESHSETLASLNDARRRSSMTAMLTIPAGFFLGMALLSAEPVAFWSAAILFVLAWFGGKRIDASRRNVVFAYDLDPGAEALYKELIEGFDALKKSRVLQYIKARGEITNLHAWKKNAGATGLVEAEKTSVVYAMPPGVASNITPPMLKIDNRSCYFFPDCILVLEGKTYGAVRYEDLRTDVRDQNMIVDKAPSDATVVGETWKYVNKKGGPDRRFKDNRRLPICEFEEIGMVSSHGFKGLLQVSRRGTASQVRDAFRAIGHISQELQDAAPLVVTYDK